MPTVLVLDEGFMSSAYAAVGLRDTKCRVIVLAGTGGRGQHNGGSIRWSLAPAVSSDAFLAVVDHVVRNDDVDVVYPMTEPIQARLWDAQPIWSDRVFPRTEAWQRELFRDKSRLSEFVHQQGVPIPATRVVCGSDDVRDALASFGTPVVVKGIRGRGGSETWIASTYADALHAVRMAHASDIPCFMQRYIVGATYLVGGVFDGGRPVRLYAGEKVEQYPVRTGPSIRIRSTHDPALVETALAVFRTAGVTGLASADFIRDDEGREGAAGRYLFLEVNPRPWGSITAAAEAGVDLFSPLAELLRGATPETDLTFGPGIESTVLPLYFRSRAFWLGGRVIRSLMHDLRGPPGVPWREPGQAAHLLYRLYRVARNWPSHATDRKGPTSA